MSNVLGYRSLSWTKFSAINNKSIKGNFYKLKTQHRNNISNLGKKSNLEPLESDASTLTFVTTK